MTIPTTISEDVLKALPEYHKPPSYTFGAAGSGCFLMPPGHPKYFVRPIYTAHGNEPRHHGASITMELFGRAVASNGEYFEWLWQDLDRLYLALPWGHERVERWLDLVYSHLRHAYRDDSHLLAAETNTPPYFFAFPSEIDGERVMLPASWQKGKLLTRLAELGGSPTDKTLHRHLAKIATPENHAAHRFVQRWYPEAKPDLERIAHPDDGLPNISPSDRWWERHEEPPS